MIMTKTTQPLTIEDMNEILYTRAEEVFLLWIGVGILGGCQL